MFGVAPGLAGENADPGGAVAVGDAVCVNATVPGELTTEAPDAKLTGGTLDPPGAENPPDGDGSTAADGWIAALGAAVLVGTGVRGCRVGVGAGVLRGVGVAVGPTRQVTFRT